MYRTDRPMTSALRTMIGLLTLVGALLSDARLQRSPAASLWSPTVVSLAALLVESVVDKAAGASLPAAAAVAYGGTLARADARLAVVSAGCGVAQEGVERAIIGAEPRLDLGEPESTPKRCGLRSRLSSGSTPNAAGGRPEGAVGSASGAVRRFDLLRWMRSALPLDAARPATVVTKAIGTHW